MMTTHRVFTSHSPLQGYRYGYDVLRDGYHITIKRAGPHAVGRTDLHTRKTVDYSYGDKNEK